MTITRELKRFLTPEAAFWIVVWLSINSGPWVLRRIPTGIMPLAHFLRTAAPFGILFLVLVNKPTQGASPLKKTLSLWLAYGCVATLAGVPMSLYPISATYWGIMYITVFLVARYFICNGPSLEQAAALNDLSWIVTSVFLLILLITAREALFVGEGLDVSGYGIVERVGTVGGMAMSRSSGMARFAAVPGVVCFVLMWQDSWLRKPLWAAVVVGSGALVYAMQSRGAILGFAAAVAFVMLFLGTKTRWAGAVLLVVAMVLQTGGLIPEETERRVMRHLTRGQEIEQMRNFTGRTRAWTKAWAVAERSPLIGLGFQADRYFIHEHVHNTYMYALLAGGFVGAGLFVIGLIWAWWLFVTAWMQGLARAVGQQRTFIQVGGILAFFTVRSGPEVCGAMFGVDTMVMVAAIAYLIILHEATQNQRFYEPVGPEAPAPVAPWQPARPEQPVPSPAPAPAFTPYATEGTWHSQSSTILDQTQES